MKNVFETAGLFLKGWFFSNLLPANMGGDAYQILYLKSRKIPFSSAAPLIFIQRVIPVLAMLFYMGGYLLLSPVFIDKHLFNVETNLIWLCFILLAVILIAGTALFFLNKNQSVIYVKTKKFFSDSFKSLSRLSFRKYSALIVFSVVFQFLRMSGIYFLLVAFHQNVDIIDLFFILSAVTIVSMLPISIGALGIQEASITFGLTLFGVPSYIGILVAFLYRSVFIILAVIGGIIFIFSKQNDSNKKKA